MARTQSKKRHFLGYAKPSNSTPSFPLPSGRSQARAEDFPSVPETSGVASRERLAARLRRFFDGSLRGTPTTITSEVADTGIGGGVKEQREQPQVALPQGATATSTDGGAQDEQEETCTASTKDAEKSTSKSVPKPPEPEPDPTAASGSKDVDAVVIQSDDIDPMPPIAKGAVDGIEYLDIGPKESDEVRAQSRKEQEDVVPRNGTVSTEAITSQSVVPLGLLPCAAFDSQVVVTSSGINPINGRQGDGEHAGCCVVCGFKLL